MRASTNLTGKTFGRLFVVKFSHRYKGKPMWECLCKCGKIHIVLGPSLTNGFTKSCGCKRIEMLSAASRFGSSGKTDTKEYQIWSGIKSRCSSPTNPLYARYGGRGITMCDRWKYSFKDFLADMGLKPTPSHSIDRINVNGNYEPGNCRWATASEQANNRRNNRIIEFNGERLTLAQWGRKLGFKTGRVRQRIMDWGWSVEKALTTPVIQQLCAK